MASGTRLTCFLSHGASSAAELPVLAFSAPRLLSSSAAQPLCHLPSQLSGSSALHPLSPSALQLVSLSALQSTRGTEHQISPWGGSGSAAGAGAAGAGAAGCGSCCWRRKGPSTQPFRIDKREFRCHRAWCLPLVLAALSKAAALSPSSCMGQSKSRSSGQTSAASCAMAANPKEFSVLTWNIWFDSMEYDKRMDYIMATCDQLRPDVICFQEVLPQMIQKLKQQAWASEYLTHSDREGMSVHPYGVLTLCKSNGKVKFHDFKRTMMGRRLLTVEVDHPMGRWVVGNVHLESLESAKLRAEQLNTSVDILRGLDCNAVLVGDFNFDATRNWIEMRTGKPDPRPLENDCIAKLAPDFADVWSTLREGEKGYTFDSELNPVIRQREQMRYDRVLARVQGPLQPSSIEMIGTEGIDSSGLRASDHFGLLVKFTSA